MSRETLIGTHLERSELEFKCIFLLAFLSPPYLESRENQKIGAHRAPSRFVLEAIRKQGMRVGGN